MLPKMPLTSSCLLFLLITFSIWRGVVLHIVSKEHVQRCIVAVRG